MLKYNNWGECPIWVLVEIIKIWKDETTTPTTKEKLIASLLCGESPEYFDIRQYATLRTLTATIVENGMYSPPSYDPIKEFKFDGFLYKVNLEPDTFTVRLREQNEYIENTFTAEDRIIPNLAIMLQCEENETFDRGTLSERMAIVREMPADLIYGLHVFFCTAIATLRLATQLYTSKLKELNAEVERLRAIETDLMNDTAISFKA
jgi:hypothetical protein